MSRRPTIEWVLTDTESLRTALSAMKKQRRLSLEDLFHRMGARLLNRFFRSEQDDLYFRTVMKAVEAMEYELVIREPQKTKTQQRLEALRKEREGTRAGEDRGRALRPNPNFDPPLPATLTDEVEATHFDPRRDERGRIRPEFELTEQEKAEAEALLAEYDFS